MTSNAEMLVINLERLFNRYYDLRGWDTDGVPTAERLHSLGLR